MIFVRSTKTEKGTILALCDEELLGKRYKEGKAVLDLERYRAFYEGELLDEEHDSVKRLIGDATTINAVGERSVSILKGVGLDTSGIRTIGGIIHLQVYRL